MVLVRIESQCCFRDLTDSKLDMSFPDPNSQPGGPRQGTGHSLSSAPPQVIEEIEEMMQNSPDPEEEEEALEEEDGAETSSQADSVLLQEMQALTQTFNNNWSHEGEGRAGAGHTPHYSEQALASREVAASSSWASGEKVALSGNEEVVEQN